MKFHIICKIVGFLAVAGHVAGSARRLFTARLEHSTLREYIDAKLTNGETTCGITLRALASLFLLEKPQLLRQHYFSWFSRFSYLLLDMDGPFGGSSIQDSRFSLKLDSTWKTLAKTIIRSKDNYILKQLVIMTLNPALHEITAKQMSRQLRFGSFLSIKRATSLVREIKTDPASLSGKDYVELSASEKDKLALFGEFQFGDTSSIAEDHFELVRSFITQFFNDIQAPLPLTTVIENLPNFFNWLVDTKKDTEDFVTMSVLTLINGIKNFSDYVGSQLFYTVLRESFFNLIAKHFVLNGKSTLSADEFDKIYKGPFIFNRIWKFANLVIERDDKFAFEKLVMFIRYPEELGEIDEEEPPVYWQRVYSAMRFNEDIQRVFVREGMHKYFSEGLITLLTKKIVKPQDLPPLMGGVACDSNAFNQDISDKLEAAFDECNLEITV